MITKKLLSFIYIDFCLLKDSQCKSFDQLLNITCSNIISFIPFFETYHSFICFVFIFDTANDILSNHAMDWSFIIVLFREINRLLRNEAERDIDKLLDACCTFEPIGVTLLTILAFILN